MSSAGDLLRSSSERIWHDPYRPPLRASDGVGDEPADIRASSSSSSLTSLLRNRFFFREKLVPQPMVNYWRNPSTCNETVGSRGHRRKTRQTWPLCRIAGCQTARLRFRCGAKRFSQLSHCENDEPQCLLTKPSRCCVSSRSDPCLWTTLCPTFCYSC